MPTNILQRRRTRDALRTFRTAWDQDAVAVLANHELRRDVFSLYWNYYANTTFSDPGWNQYKAQNKLYRQIRSLYNPAARLCDFYAASVYPGPLSEDGANLPEGMPLAIPLPNDTPPEIRTAIAQSWQWSNWQDGKSIYVLYGAVFGSVLLEVVDDLEREKVLTEITKPDKIADIVLDHTGNVKAYALEYDTELPVLDQIGRVQRIDRFKFRKEVDAEEFRYFKNDKPFTDFPGGAVQDNPYGFVPAVWARHRNVGSDWGVPAIDGIITRIDELNSVGAHTLDQVHKVIGSPILISGEGKVTNITDIAKRTTPTEESEIDRLPNDSELLMILKTAANTTVQPLAGNLSVSDAVELMKSILDDISEDRPELTMWRQMRDMQQVSAPGAMKLMGDVTARVSASAAQYDARYKQHEQQKLAIGGFRINSGHWLKMDSQQQKYAPFDLESYAKGELDFDISPRPLVIPTNADKYTDLGLLMTAVASAKSNGIPLDYFFQKFLGWSPEEVAELTTKLAAEQAAQDDRSVVNAGRQAAAGVIARMGDTVGDVAQ